MGLERENILTLIGRNRYHSCILTTFSFDFYFFEMKVMRHLRSCGTRNVNVFIDGYFYAELMQEVTGEEMQLTPGYSLYPVFQNKTFHPKLWMLFGNKEGLMIVGSGNLTNSGNGNNDEIWGAFHFDIRSNENGSIFSAAWNYISMLSSTVKGQMYEKTTKWITEHSQWLLELPTIKPFQFFTNAQQEQVAFLFNSNNSTIWNEMLSHISDQKIDEITAISPFYDSDGKTLQELKECFPLAQINVILEGNGSIPLSMKPDKTFVFYNWGDVGVSKEQDSKSLNRRTQLHAKIIHFKTKSGKEFCLFGSANVTSVGLGIAGANASNSEVSLLIQSETGGLLASLGISLKPGKSKKLSEFSATTSISIYQTLAKNHHYKMNLLSAELTYDEISIYLSRHSSNKLNIVNIVLFDKENRILSSQSISEFNDVLKVKISSTLNRVHYVQLANHTNEFVSNRILVSDYFLVARTHPNPKTESIEGIYSEIQNGEFGKILDLLQYAIMDETEEENKNFVINDRINEVEADVKKEYKELYDLSSYKPVEYPEFENKLFSSPALRVLEVIRSINQHPFSNIGQDIRADEQEENMAIIEGNEESEAKPVINLSHDLLKGERRKLFAYFNKLYCYQQNLLLINHTPIKHKLSLTDLTKYLIALELILEYSGKTEKYSEDRRQHFFNYMPLNGNYENKNTKGCSLNLIGDFLMLAVQGFKEYEFEYTKKKVIELKLEALVSTIVCLLNNNWSEEEAPYFISLLLNALHYLGCKDIHDFVSNFSLLKGKILHKISKLKHQSGLLSENKNIFFKKVCPIFETVISRIAKKEFDASALQGQMIYKSLFGYCYVKSVSKANEFTLIRPGFFWNEEIEEYINYSPDKIYKPLRLNHFICINI